MGKQIEMWQIRGGYGKQMKYGKLGVKYNQKTCYVAEMDALYSKIVWFL